MSQPSSDSPNRVAQGVHESARREKLRKIIQMGIDPWGGRFDDRSHIGDIRALRARSGSAPRRASTSIYQTTAKRDRFS
jgi:hypothetical protein